MLKILIIFSILCLNNAHAVNKNEESYLREADVCFDIQKNRGKLELIGKEKGKKKFNLQITDSTFNNFTEYTEGNFHIARLDNRLLLQYRADDDKEALDIFIKQNGDVEFRETEQKYTGCKTYGVRTNGILENRGNQAFFFLVASAKQIHNYGTILSYNVQFFQNYLFNSGVLQFGEMPLGITDLLITHSTNKNAAPMLKMHTIENYGTFKSNGQFNIKGGLHYHEHGTSDFENLATSGGDINVNNGSMEVKETLSGGVRDLTLQNNSMLGMKKSNVGSVRNFHIGDNGLIHSKEAFNLQVKGRYQNSGSLISDDRISLTVENLGSNQQGVLYAPHGVTTRVMTVEREKARYEAAKAAREKREVERKKQQEEKEQARKERAKAEELVKVAEVTCKISEAIIKINDGLSEIVYAEHMIAAGYTQRADGSWYRSRSRHRGMVFNFGIGTGGIHFRGHTAGYCPNELDELPSKIWARQIQFQQDLDREKTILKNAMDKVAAWKAIENRPLSPSLPIPTLRSVPSKVGNVYTEVTPAVQAARDREYISGIFRGVREEAFSVYTDPNMRLLFSSIRDWTGLEPKKREELLGKYPKVRGPIEALDNLRRDAGENRSWWDRIFNPTQEEKRERLERCLNNPVDKFITEHPEFLLGPVSLGVQGLETAGAMAIQRVAPKLLAVGVVAKTWENFVSYMKGGKNAVSSKQTGTSTTNSTSKNEVPKVRVMETKQTQEACWQKLKNSGEWSVLKGKDIPTLRNNSTGELIQKSHEKYDIEVYDSRGNHIGVIRPSEGFIRKEFAVKGRRIK